MATTSDSRRPKPPHKQHELGENGTSYPNLSQHSIIHASGRIQMGDSSRSQNRPVLNESPSAERTRGSDAFHPSEGRFARGDFGDNHRVKINKHMRNSGSNNNNKDSSDMQQSRRGTRGDDYQRGDTRLEPVPRLSTELTGKSSPQKIIYKSDFDLDHRRLQHRHEAIPAQGHNRSIFSDGRQQRHSSSDTKASYGSRPNRSLNALDRRISPQGRSPRSPSLDQVFRHSASLSTYHRDATNLMRSGRSVDGQVWTHDKRAYSRNNRMIADRLSHVSRRMPNHGRVSPELTHVQLDDDGDDGAASIVQQHRSSLGSRWGPRPATGEDKMPDVVAASCCMGKVRLEDGCNNDALGNVLLKEMLGDQENSLKGSLQNMCDQLPLVCDPPGTYPHPTAKFAGYGFTTKESLAVETTELTEISATATASLDGTNAIRSSSSSSSSSTLSSCLPEPKQHGSPPPVVTVPPLEPSIPCLVTRPLFRSKLVEWIYRPNTTSDRRHDDSAIRSKKESLALEKQEKAPINGDNEKIPKKKVFPHILTSKSIVERSTVDSVQGCHVSVPGQSCVSETKRGKARDCIDISLIRVGSRVAVYWDGEGRYYKGRVVRERPGKKKPFFLRYDDGDEEWMSFQNTRFRLLSSPMKGATVDQKALPQRFVTQPPYATEPTVQPSQVTKKRKTMLFQDGGPRKLAKKCLAKEAVLLTSDTKDASKRQSKPVLGCSDSSHDGRVNGVHASLSDSEMKTVPRCIATGTTKAPGKVIPRSPESDVLEWVAAGVRLSSDGSDSDTDEEELAHWATTMLGATRPIVSRISPDDASKQDTKDAHILDPTWDSILDIASLPISISEKVKLGRRKNSCSISYGVPVPLRKKAKPNAPKKRMLSLAEKEREAKLKKEQARPLTVDEINSILGDDLGLQSSSWVRRSVRQPSKSSLSAPRVKALLEKLAMNDLDMVVLKMKKYCSDLDTPSLVIDAVLDSLEDNTNCEALYIQNFNEGMRDDQVLHLIKVLQRPSCKIWCLNIGETYKVKMETWEKFANGLEETNITHMYASEHTITAELKDQIRETIRLNRTKHSMHCDPTNLDTIVKCTHCWWNPVNTKSLRPYLQRKGYEHILADAEVQGLQGSMSGATLS